METKNLLVSFSGGETSGYMAQWIKNNLADQYDKILFAFANTGLENEETLKFVEQCDKHFNLGVHWVEAKFNPELGIGTTFNLVDYARASRNGEPFEELIKKFGIPGPTRPRCSSELKKGPLEKYAKHHFGTTKFTTAIGIRADEMDRINWNKRERIIYPLCDPKMVPMTKPQINLYWSQMPFRLKLKGYQGNCTTCWKKSINKLYQICNETPEAFDFFERMENEYKWHRTSTGRPYYFFRDLKSVKDIREGAKVWAGIIKDSHQVYEYQMSMFDETESCDIYSNCGDEE